jgi:hypothetical protein
MGAIQSQLNVTIGIYLVWWCRGRARVMVTHVMHSAAARQLAIELTANACSMTQSLVLIMV